MKPKSFFVILLMISVSGCHLLPNRSDVHPTHVDEIPEPFEANQSELFSTIQADERVVITPPLDATAMELIKTLESTSIPYPYRLQVNSPKYIQNYAHPENGCNWLGIAGQVFDKTGQPVINQIVVVKGYLVDNLINSITITRLNSANQYGPGGYEVVLGNKTIDSQNMISIQLFDENGMPQSDPIFVETYLDCVKNLIIVNFQLMGY